MKCHILDNQIPETPCKKSEDKKLKPWKGELHLGFEINTGNSRKKNVSGAAKLKYQREHWDSKIEINGQLASDKGGKTDNNFQVLGDTNYYFHLRHFVFGNIDYQYDEFNPYIYVTTLVGGYGWKAINKEIVQLKFKAGPGYRHQKEATSEKIDNDIVIYGAGELLWLISENAKFKQIIAITDGSRNTYTEAKTILTTKIIGDLNLEASFLIKHNTKIPRASENRCKTDPRTCFSLVYNF